MVAQPRFSKAWAGARCGTTGHYDETVHPGLDDMQDIAIGSDRERVRDNRPTRKLRVGRSVFVGVHWPIHSHTSNGGPA